MILKDLKNIYLVGIGGMGMSALARYFKQIGIAVRGYDRVKSSLTQTLIDEGIDICFEADVNSVDEEADMVIYTPAIPQQHPIIQWYQSNGYPLYKRSDVLQQITKDMECIAVAGSHGKTTITTMIAHILRVSGLDSSAFLGGISVNYKTNYWKQGTGDIAVVEADEYDRSFLKLAPKAAVVTAMDIDHLDVYGDEQALQEAFIEYTDRIKPDGVLWYKHGLSASSRFSIKKKYSYSLQNNAADAWAEHIQMKEGGYTYDWKNKEGKVISGLRLPLGGMHNVENSVVAIAIALEYGIETEEIKEAIGSFKGVKRRFEYIIRHGDTVYIDDYAHHPKEIEALIQSAKLLFPKRRCSVIFQPHLYSRTLALAEEFAKSLSMADQVILLPVYPAREEPIPGVDASLIQSKMVADTPCTILSKEGLLQFVEEAPLELVITAGAGDIDRLVAPIKRILTDRER